MNIRTFLRDCGKETYPEPRTEMHDHITGVMMERVLKHLPEKAYVFDIGCGQGPALELFREKGHIASGIALTVEDVKACKDKGFSVHLRDQHSLESFAGQWFDLIWARHVLEHSPAPFFVLKSFAELLPPNGILYVELPSPETSCAHELNANHYSVMGFRMWASLIQRAGFEIIEAGEIPIETAAGPDKYFMFIAKRN